MVKQDRFRKLEKDSYDVIVVGAGMGGLTTAAILARKGHSVLVVDQHYVPGGCNTLFRRPGYEFDIGLHYIGDCEPNGVIPRVLRVAGVEDIQFREMDPDGFETYHLPDFTFRVPRSLELFRERLLDRFPEEKRGINRYIRFLRQMGRIMRAEGRPLRFAWTLLTSPMIIRYANKTLGELFDSCTKNPQLRTVLAGQNGTYCEPPSRAAALLHGGVCMHYFFGSYYPTGGGQKISDRLAEEIENHGGKILLRARAEKIVVKDGRVEGVELDNPHLGKVIVRAPLVVSNADLKKTLLELVGPEHLSPKRVERTRNFVMSPPLGVVFLGIKRDLKAENFPNSNHLIFPEYDFEKMYQSILENRFYEKPLCYLTFASLKDPENQKIAPEGITNLQIMTGAPASYEAWGITKEEFQDGSYRKKEAYLEKKEAFAKTLIGIAEKALPGLGAQIDYQEVSTPITHRRYTGSSGGTSYGLALIPSQFLKGRPGNRTGVEGLYLCGASTRTAHGIAGVMLSGIHVAAKIVGKSIFKEFSDFPDSL